MKIRDHKMLWGRSGNRCAMCRKPLTQLNELGMASIVGEEAHIVAKTLDGPRGSGPLPLGRRDEYSNLILLCPTDHTLIDSLPVGPIDYPVDRLHEIKGEHEKWISQSTDFDKRAQLAQEQWAGLLDELGARMNWDGWYHFTSHLFSADGPSLPCDDYDQLRSTLRWIHSRVWPHGYSMLRDAIRHLGLVLNDLLIQFDKHSIRRNGGLRPYYETAKFYKNEGWVPNYDDLVRKFEYHMELIQDLTLELTRYGNWIAEIVRIELDPSYRFDEGVLTISRGMTLGRLGAEMLRPEFSEEDLSSGQPYGGFENFKIARANRDIHVGTEGRSSDPFQ